MTKKYIPTNERQKLWTKFEVLVGKTQASYHSIGAIIQNPMDFTEEDLDLGLKQFNKIRSELDSKLEEFGHEVFGAFTEGSVFEEMAEGENIPAGGQPRKVDQ